MWGKLVGLDLESDLAIVHPEAHDSKQPFDYNRYPPVKLDGMRPRQGDPVGTLGSPLGLRNSLTTGVVGAVNRSSEDARQPDTRIKYIQTDLHINPGSSGGPLFTRSGVVVGMVTTRAEVEGISFAIQLDSVHGMITELERQRKVFRPWLGICGLTLQPDLILQVKDANRRELLSSLQDGLLVTRVRRNSPGEDASLQPGDIITHVNDHRVNGLGDIVSKCTLEHPQIDLAVVRLVKDPQGAWRMKPFNSTLSTSEFDILLNSRYKQGQK